MKPKIASPSIVFFALLALACSGREPHPRLATRLIVVPDEVTIAVGTEQQFVARYEDGEPASVRWSVLEPGGGEIDPDGKYSAPSTPQIATIVATSTTSSSDSATSKVSVEDAPPAKVKVSIRPSSVDLMPGESVQFHAVVEGTDDRRVSWTVLEDGVASIDETGRFTASGSIGPVTVRAMSIVTPSAFAEAVVDVKSPIDLSILPEDRRTVWNPGIPGGIPRQRQLFTTLSDLPPDGTEDISAPVNAAINEAGAAYLKTGVIQEVVLPEGTFRLTKTLALSRSGVVLRGQGPTSRLRYDGDQNSPAILIGRSRWTDYGNERGPWPLVADGSKGSRKLMIAAEHDSRIQVGDILGIDEEDDPSFVSRGDGWYGKRQMNADTHGPALRGEGLWRSVGTMVEVTGKEATEQGIVLHLRDPLHMNFRSSRHAQIFQIASPRKGFDEVQLSGIESLYLTGGTITTNNVSYCWLDNLEIDGNPGTDNIGAYENPGGIEGHSIELFHAYRCEIRTSYIHHSRRITQGGGSYLITLSGYTSESLIEDNIVVFGNKLIVGNMMGGGNVIAYNYVDNARTNSASWQEGAIDLNHLSFTHSALVEGNWTSNMGADTTHGNAGWHVFHRNFSTGRNSAPIYGAFPYSRSPDGSFMRAVGIDGFHRESSFIGNVLHTDPSGVYQIDHSGGPRLNIPTIWRIGGAVDGRGELLDDGTALSLLYRHGNWDSVTGQIVWDPENSNRTIQDSMYLHSKPDFFGSAAWPWVDPTGQSLGDRVKRLPAKDRYDAIVSE